MSAALSIGVGAPALRDGAAAALPRHFDLNDDAAYQAWRAGRLAAYPRRADELIVEVRRPQALSEAELAALRERCRRANMAVYATSGLADDAGSAAEAARRIALQLGLRTVDVNYLADDDGITPLSVHEQGPRSGYIPYTNRAIRWHTDGYYNPPERSIRAMLLHCVRDAASGGANRLLDHEIAYILLRDEDPAHIEALMKPDVMTIPARSEEGEIARGDQSGPVFSIAADGSLHMRYTARTRSISWKDDAATHAAVAALSRILDSTELALQLRMSPGMGLVCNNVLHDRAAFADSATRRRLVLRARYFERIAL
ncbi:MAG: TauD/TfdA family dioxygenase [Burkholderiales bacterium]|nr:MAG: TauD/TfdA family dioxygenase [Burkholderiales bacterium]